VADPDQAFGGQFSKGRQNFFACLNTPASLRKSLGITQKWSPFLGQENGYFLVELCDLSGNHHSLKSPFVINSQKV